MSLVQKLLCCSILVLSFGVCAKSSVISHDTILSRLNEYRYSENLSVNPEENIQELEMLDFVIAEALESNPDDSELWSMRSLIQYSFIYAYPIEQQLEGDAKLRREIFQKVNNYASEALNLDANEVDEMTPSMLAGLANVGSSEIIIQANTRYLERKTDLSVQEEIDKTGQTVTHLVKLGKFDEAANKTQILFEKYPEKKWLLEDLKDIERQRSNWGNNKAEVEDQKKKASVEVVKPAKLIKQLVSTVEDKPVVDLVAIKIQEPSGNNLWFLLIGFFAVFVIGGLWLRRK